MVRKKSGEVTESDVACVEVGEVRGVDGELILTEDVEGCDPGCGEHTTGACKGSCGGAFQGGTAAVEEAGPIC